jgi:hypothetical protein
LAGGSLVGGFLGGLWAEGFLGGLWAEGLWAEGLWADGLLAEGLWADGFFPGLLADGFFPGLLADGFFAGLLAEGFFAPFLHSATQRSSFSGQRPFPLHAQTQSSVAFFRPRRPPFPSLLGGSNGLNPTAPTHTPIAVGRAKNKKSHRVTKATLEDIWLPLKNMSTFI